MNAKTVFTLLFLLNLLNYVDRQILFSVFPLIKTDLNLSDSQLGILASAFMFVYMLAAPLTGYIADRKPRQYIMSFCAFIWSIATILTGKANNYLHLFAARSFIGIGEAGFTAIAPSFLAERFKEVNRAKVLAFFGLALPIGSALGYFLGGVLGLKFGWRTAFFIVGMPAAILAALVLFLLKDIRQVLPESKKIQFKNYLSLLKNKPFLFICLAQAMSTFTLGGLAAWMPTFMNRYYSFSVAQAGTVFGAVTVIAGAAGTFLGGIFADRLLRKTKQSYYIVAAVSFLAALPLGAASLLLTGVNPYAAIGFLGAAVMCVFMPTGPINAAVVSTTDIKIRSMAFAVNIFIIHALGDAISPALLGGVSDMFNLKTAVWATLFFIIPAALFSFLAAKSRKSYE